MQEGEAGGGKGRAKRSWRQMSSGEARFLLVFFWVVPLGAIVAVPLLHGWKALTAGFCAMMLAGGVYWTLELWISGFARRAWERGDAKTRAKITRWYMPAFWALVADGYLIFGLFLLSGWGVLFFRWLGVGGLLFWTGSSVSRWRRIRRARGSRGRG